MSIKKIAEMAGVSVSTVSRVLNNPKHKCSSEQVREKICRAARELNYVPNEAARSLKIGALKSQQSFYRINILMTLLGSASVDPFFSETMRMMESEIHKNSCIISQIWSRPIFSNDDKCEERNIKPLVEEMFNDTSDNSDGLIIFGKCNEVVLNELHSRCKNIVSVNRYPVNNQIDEIVCNGRKIAVMAVEYLIKLGHRKIGYVGDCHFDTKYNGYQETLFKYNMQMNIDWVFETEQREDHGYSIMERFLQMDSTNRPTAIFCSNDIIAVGMLKCLDKNKSKFYSPSIISCDDIEAAQYTNPMLSTVRVPTEEMVRLAFTLLLDRIKGGHKSKVYLEVEGALILRESCRDISETTYECEYYI